jgi:hypothetical protein
MGATRGALQTTWGGSGLREGEMSAEREEQVSDGEGGTAEMIEYMGLVQSRLGLHASSGMYEMSKLPGG